MAEIPAAVLRELVKRAYYAAEYDGYESVESLRELHPDVGALTDEIQALDEGRSGDVSFEDI